VGDKNTFFNNLFITIKRSSYYSATDVCR